jgi:hypothetical protein
MGLTFFIRRYEDFYASLIPNTSNEFGMYMTEDGFKKSYPLYFPTYDAIVQYINEHYHGSDIVDQTV